MPNVMNRSSLEISGFVNTMLLYDAAYLTIDFSHLKTKACLSPTRRTKASVRPSRDNSGRLAPPAKESTMVSVEPLVRFLWKIAYMPLWTSAGRTELHSRNFNEYSTHLCYIQNYWYPQRSSRKQCYPFPSKEAVPVQFVGHRSSLPSSPMGVSERRAAFHFQVE